MRFCRKTALVFWSSYLVSGVRAQLKPYWVMSTQRMVEERMVRMLQYTIYGGAHRILNYPSGCGEYGLSQSCSGILSQIIAQPVSELCYFGRCHCRIDTPVSFVQNSREFHAKQVSYFAKKYSLFRENRVLRNWLLICET